MLFALCTIISIAHITLSTILSHIIYNIVGERPGRIIPIIVQCYNIHVAGKPFTHGDYKYLIFYQTLKTAFI